MRVSIIVILLVVITSSCSYFGGERIRGNGSVVTQNISTGSFSAVDASGDFTIYVSEGPNSVQVETDQNLIEYLDIHTSGDELVIDTKRGFNLLPSRDLIIHVSAPAYKSISGSGSVDVFSKTPVTGQGELNLEVSGSGDFKLQVNAPKIRSSISGSGSMELSGTAVDYSAEVSGSGDIRTFGLTTENSNIELSGSASAEVTASKSLDIQISGSGSVKYKGNPAVKQSVSGSGSIQKVG